MTLESLRIDGKPVESSFGHVDGHPRESIGELFSRLAEDSKGYAAAQVEVVKQTASTGLEKGGVGVGMIVGGGLLAYAGLIVFLVAVFSWLEDMIGPIGSGIVVTAATLVLAFLLFRMGMGKINEAKAAISGKRI